MRTNERCSQWIASSGPTSSATASGPSIQDPFRKPTTAARSTADSAVAAISLEKNAKRLMQSATASAKKSTSPGLGNSAPTTTRIAAPATERVASVQANHVTARLAGGDR